MLKTTKEKLKRTQKETFESPLKEKDGCLDCEEPPSSSSLFISELIRHEILKSQNTDQEKKKETIIFTKHLSSMKEKEFQGMQQSCFTCLFNTKLLKQNCLPKKDKKERKKPKKTSSCKLQNIRKEKVRQPLQIIYIRDARKKLAVFWLHFSS